jgi:membrane associated rhomboid family serine protease
MEFLRSPVMLIIMAFVLLALGIALPFLMMIQLLQSTLLLNFLAYIASFGGLVIGVVGLVSYSRTDNDRDDDYYKR